MAILSILLTVIIVAVSFLMVLIVLIQRPKQEGLGAAFGGSTLDSALGAHTTDILQKITTWLGIIFFVSAIGLAMVKTRQFQSTAASDVLEEVKEREPMTPGLPPELSNLPALNTPMSTEETPLAPGTSLLDDSKINDDVATPAPADDAPAAPADDAPAAPADDAPTESAEVPAAEEEAAPVENPASEKEAADAKPKGKGKAASEGEGKGKAKADKAKDGAKSEGAE